LDELPLVKHLTVVDFYPQALQTANEYLTDNQQPASPVAHCVTKQPMNI